MTTVFAFRRHLVATGGVIFVPLVYGAVAASVGPLIGPGRLIGHGGVLMDGRLLRASE